MDKSESVTEIFKALSAFQGDLENVDKNKAGHGYKYATLGACIEAAKVPLKANGLSVTQLVGSNDKGPTMETILGHASGEYISTTVDMPLAKLQGGGGGNPSQVLGASITYMRRYQYAAVLGLAQEDSDAKPLTDIDKQWVKTISADLTQTAQITDVEYLKYIVGNL
tara:strand:+ start:286 stop:786 length:501 start_codon:yes stop_codon:yes gene_type:complete